MKATWNKRLSVSSAKKLAIKYNLGRYEEYCKMDGYFYFENGRVGDCTPCRTEVRPNDSQDVEIDLNDKQLKFVRY